MEIKYNKYKVTKGKKTWIIESIFDLKEVKKSVIKGSKVEEIKDESKNKTELCVRCKKNKASINFTNSITDFTHGFVEHICKSCYDKIKHDNTWYKEGKKETIELIKEILSKKENENNSKTW